MLSGGERGRLALAKLALEDTNLLLLDEPTNHLDIPSQEILESVLDDYDGTILLVTHDRYLVDAIATQIWEIDTDESHLLAYNGTYSQLRAERESKVYEAFMVAQNKTTSHSGPLTPESRQPKTASKKSANTKEEKRKIARQQQLENKIAELEAQLNEIGAALANPPKDAGEVMQLAKEYDRIQKEMDEKFVEWEGMQG